MRKLSSRKNGESLKLYPFAKNFWAVTGFFTLGMVFLLAGCNQPNQPLNQEQVLQPEGGARSSAALSFEDRQMMRHYLMQKIFGVKQELPAGSTDTGKD
jgi:hypothetical protein